MNTVEHNYWWSKVSLTAIFTEGEKRNLCTDINKFRTDGLRNYSFTVDKSWSLFYFKQCCIHILKTDRNILIFLSDFFPLQPGEWEAESWRRKEKELSEQAFSYMKNGFASDVLFYWVLAGLRFAEDPKMTKEKKKAAMCFPLALPLCHVMGERNHFL